MKTTTTYTNAYESAKNLLKGGNVLRVFDAIDYHFVTASAVEYSLTAEAICEAVQKFGEGFVVDICTKVLNDNIRLSDKQRWCVAFAFMKLTAEMVDSLCEAPEADDIEAAAAPEVVEVEAAAENIETPETSEPSAPDHRDHSTTPACTPTVGSTPCGVYPTPTPAVTANHRRRSRAVLTN